MGKTMVTKKDHLSCRCRVLAAKLLFSHSKQSKIDVPRFCSYRNTHHRAISSQANLFWWLIKPLRFTLEFNQLQKQFVASDTPKLRRLLLSQWWERTRIFRLEADKMLWLLKPSVLMKYVTIL